MEQINMVHSESVPWTRIMGEDNRVWGRAGVKHTLSRGRIRVRVRGVVFISRSLLAQWASGGRTPNRALVIGCSTSG